MAKRRPDSNRRDLATWLMLLLPGFMFVGLLAPAAVSVKPKAQDEIGPISFRNFRPRRPIQFALPVGQAAFSESGLESVFAGARYVVDQAKRVVAFDFQANDDKQIVLNEDDVENYVAETLFEASIEGDPQQLVVDLIPLWDPSVFDVIPALIDRTAWTQWDDFHGTSLPTGSGPGTVIPEPAPGALLAIGLAALAIRRKRA